MAPHGSPQASLLFNVYANDLSSSIPNSTIFQYAGDTALVLEDVHEKANKNPEFTSQQ